MPNARVSARCSCCWKPWWEQPVSVADDDWMDVEPVFVDQVQPHEGHGEVCATERQVAPGFGLQSPDLAGVDVVDDRRVPIGMFERA